MNLLFNKYFQGKAPKKKVVKCNKLSFERKCVKIRIRILRERESESERIIEQNFVVIQVS
jgi:hypothetical protein